MRAAKLRYTSKFYAAITFGRSTTSWALVTALGFNRNIADSLNIITKQNRFVKQKTEFAKEIKNIFRFRSPHNFADAHAQKGRQYAEHKILGHIEQIVSDRGLPDSAVIHVKTPY